MRWDNTTGHTGVSPHGRAWRARYQGRHLGTFPTVALAARAYRQAAGIWSPFRFTVPASVIRGVPGRSGRRRSG